MFALLIVRDTSPTFKRSQPDYAEVYRFADIFQDSGLSRGDFILFALLIGCDYDTVCYAHTRAL